MAGLRSKVKIIGALRGTVSVERVREEFDATIKSFVICWKIINDSYSGVVETKNFFQLLHNKLNENQQKYHKLANNELSAYGKNRGGRPRRVWGKE